MIRPEALVVMKDQGDRFEHVLREKQTAVGRVSEYDAALLKCFESFFKVTDDYETRLRALEGR